MIKLKEVLHLYIGSRVQTKITQYTLSGAYPPDACFVNNDYGQTLQPIPVAEVKPILRQYRGMNSDDAVKMFDHFHPDEIEKRGRQYKINYMKLLLPFRDSEEPQSAGVTPEFMLYLLKEGFDLFGLIDSGQAVDAKTLK